MPAPQKDGCLPSTDWTRQTRSQSAPRSWPALFCEGSLSWPEEEHRPTHRTVCAVQSVDGPQQISGGTGLSAPAKQRKTPAGTAKQPEESGN